MIWTVSFLVLIAGFITTIASGMGKCPLWIAVLLLCIFSLLQVLPK